MLTCVASSKQPGPPPDDDVVVAGVGTPRSRHTIKSLTTQIKEMAIKASGAYRQCKPCSGAVVVEKRDYMESEASVSGNRTPPSMSGLTEEATSVFMEEEEEEGGEREWISQVEPGVLITFVSVAGGGNDLKRIRFSREMFNKWQAQRWWAENHEKVMELYNVQGTNHPPPTLPGSEDESSKKEMVNPMTPPLNEERPNGNSSQRAVMGSSSSDESQEQHQGHSHSRDSPVLSSNSGVKTGMLCKSSSSSSSNMEEEEEEEEEEKEEVEGSGGETSVSTSNDSSDQEREWVQQDEPGVYLTIRARPGGVRELRRVRFSRERFGEMLARMWWEENRDRIHQQYLFKVN
ncbi:hypothetical protein J5N97_009447 [Dioscorea zingiberensis]|uniref:BRX domain-containing protein n=1 Tax=Dioscorea zingiberensis TaxID=325984 RepID=A0A9D5CYS7_9LILI|nr:hypothetical protein J5N97_009447 [Dioscorea zingiberensis]